MMKLKLRDLIVGLMAVAIAAGAGYLLAFQRYEPGVRFLAAWIRGGEPAAAAHDPLAARIITEDPVIFIPSDRSDEWHLRVMGRQQAKSEESIRIFLIKMRKAVPNANVYVRIVADDDVRMGTVMHVLRLCADCGYEDADVNGLTGHNYTAFGKE